MSRLNGTLPTIPDTELIAGVLRKEEQAFRTLYRRHTPHVLPIVLRMLDGVEADAEDVVQDAWISATKALPSFRGDASFRTWLIGIAMNRCKSLMRRRGRWAALDDPAVAASIALVAQPVAGLSLDLERAVALLTPSARAVLLLHEIEGYTHDEIGAMLGIATGTSKAHLHHARRALRALLEPQPKGHHVARI